MVDLGHNRRRQTALSAARYQRAFRCRNVDGAVDLDRHPYEPGGVRSTPNNARLWRLGQVTLRNSGADASESPD